MPTNVCDACVSVCFPGADSLGRAVQDTLPPGSIAAFHRNYPEFAGVAVPQKPGEGIELGLTMFPPDPTKPPTVDEHVTIPRGYLEYLEAFVNEHLQAVADAEAGGAATEAAAAEGGGAGASAAPAAAAAAAAAPAAAAEAPAAEAAAAPAAAAEEGGDAGGPALDSVMVDTSGAGNAAVGQQQPAQNVQ